MKNKQLLMVFVFVLTSTLTSTCLFAQSKKDTAKPVKSELPSIIKTINMPWPVSAAVDEKENRVFVMSVAGENSAVFVLNGRDNSIVKKVRVEEGFDNVSAGNASAYDSNTGRLYTLLDDIRDDSGRTSQSIAVIDTKSYKILSKIKMSDPDNIECCVAMSINLSQRHNMIYSAPRLGTLMDPYIFAFNASSYKLAEKLTFKNDGRTNFTAIDENGDFLYMAADKFIKFDIKAKKVVASLPINVSSVPLIDEKNSLIFAASAYKLYIIDLKTFKIKDEREDVPFPATGGASIALNPTTNHLFVPTYQDSVSVIDVPTMKILTTIKVGQTVKGIAVNSKTNKVYVTLINENNKVVVIQDAVPETKEKKVKGK